MPTSEVSSPFSIPSNILSSPDSVPAPEQPLGGPLTQQLNDLFPWPFHCLPGPYQDMFRYQKVVRGYDHREISRHKLRTSEAPKDFISCYLAQIIKVGQRGLQRAGGEGWGGGGGVQRGSLPSCISFRSHGLRSSPWPQIFQSMPKQPPFGFFLPSSPRPVLLQIWIEWEVGDLADVRASTPGAVPFTQRILVTSLGTGQASLRETPGLC